MADLTFTEAYNARGAGFVPDGTEILGASAGSNTSGNGNPDTAMTLAEVTGFIGNPAAIFVGQNRKYTTIKDATDYVKSLPAVNTTDHNTTGTLNSVATGDTLLTLTGGNLWDLWCKTTNPPGAAIYDAPVWSPDGVEYYVVEQVIDNNTFVIASPYLGDPITGPATLHFGYKIERSIYVEQGNYNESIDLRASDASPLFISVFLLPGATLNQAAPPEFPDLDGGSSLAHLYPPNSGILRLSGGVVKGDASLTPVCRLVATQIYINDLDFRTLAADVMQPSMTDVGRLECSRCIFQSVQDGFGILMAQTTGPHRFMIFNDCTIMNTHMALGGSGASFIGVRMFFSTATATRRYLLNNCNIVVSTYGITGGGSVRAILVDLLQPTESIFNNCNIELTGEVGGATAALFGSWNDTGSNTAGAKATLNGGTLTLSSGADVVQDVSYNNSCNVVLNSVDLQGAATAVTAGNLTVEKYNVWNDGSP